MTIALGTANLDAANAEAPDWSRTVLHHGDMHHGATNVAARIAIAKTALLALPAPAARVQMGDLVEPDNTTNDNLAKTYLTDLGFDRVVIGNHDCDSGRTPAAAATAFGFNARNWTMDLSFVRLIGVSPVSFPANGSANEGTCVLDQVALDYLDAQLASATLPCMIFTHAPLENTVISETTGNNAGYSSSEPAFGLDPDVEVRAILNEHSSAKVFISGHTHSFMSATGFVKEESVGDRNIVCVNSSAIRGQHRPPDLQDPIIIVFTTLTTTHVEVRVYDCRTRRWAIWPDLGRVPKRIAIPS